MERSTKTTGKCDIIINENVTFSFKAEHTTKATITLCDLSAAILFEFAHSRSNGFNLVQLYVMNSKESARQITPSKTSLSQRERERENHLNLDNKC